MKRHIDCDWLIKKQNGFFQCCDIRGAMRGKELSEEEALEKACKFFHCNNDNASRYKHPILVNIKKVSELV